MLAERHEQHLGKDLAPNKEGMRCTDVTPDSWPAGRIVLVARDAMCVGVLRWIMALQGSDYWLLICFIVGIRALVCGPTAVIAANNGGQ